MIVGIPPRYSCGSSDLIFWENFLSDHEINQILSFPQWSQTSDAYVGGTGPTLDPKKRTTTIGWMGMNDSTSHIWKKIVHVVSHVNSTHFHYDLDGCFEPAQLGLYTANEQSHYDWHADDSPEAGKVPRKLSMSLMLDDPSSFEGGDLQVLYQSGEPRTLEQKRGRAWFFPSWMLHRVTPVTKGVRRSLVLWVGGPAFR